MIERGIPSLLVIFALLFAAAALPACAEGISVPSIQITLDDAGDDPKNVSAALKLLFIFTILSLAPAILIMVTSFTRIVVVLSLLRHALGTQQIPANQIIIGLSLFLTFFIMMPVWNQVNQRAVQPYLHETMDAGEALNAAAQPVKKFMLAHTRQKDLALFLRISSTEKPAVPEDTGLSALIPAFVISELKTAFQIGFMIYMPFLILDMVVASVLLSMGMLMLPPIMVSLPFKLLLFVLVDGWYLIVGSLVESFT
ncbi:MAG: flagellar type III secretion system pore protein FliP [Syntrophales bacterium]|jgi:flagellar biosynthetic protein FliP|nr:flagellar type III secretion system pore protein FliP [Syntrophales bacterium]MDY0043114.1 flagellar type III secretion system pore protein FliP [Syntrophales bacterium]